jgi:6-pyruvoyltetrahydropterin/6-carboxytetrahydropterin synthase
MTEPSANFELTRVVRLPISALADRPDGGTRNGLVGVPGPDGIGALAAIEVACAGPVEASGYVVDIGLVDRLVRREAGPRIARAVRAECESGAATDLVAFLGELAASISAELPAPLVRLAYAPVWSPTLAFRSTAVEFEPPRTIAPASGPGTHAMTAPNATPAPRAAVLTETFEFAASHRLHLADRGADENRVLFGKCNNPNGHGHNYRVEVAVEVPIGANDTPRFGFHALGEAIEDEVMRRFDHRNLNLDCPEFATLNPSVEHIAFVCHDLLAPRIARDGAKLRFVRVWETDKTSCRYPA